jgi:hypothetical protein
MARRRALLCGVLGALYLALIGAVSFSTPDVAWSPSYFDDDGDDDSLPQAMKRTLVVTVDILPPVPVPLTSVPVVLPQASPRSLLLPDPSRLRAPPTP